VKRSQSIRTVVAAAVLALVVAGLFVVMIFAILSVHDASRTADGSDAEIAAGLAEQRLVVDLQGGLQRFLATGDRQFADSWQADLGELAIAQARLARATDDRVAATLVRRIHDATADYLEQYARPLAAVGARPPSGRALADAIADGESRLDGMNARYSALVAHERGEAAAARRAAGESLDRAVVFGSVSMALLVVLALIFATHQLRSVVRPVRRVGAAARRLAGGDLTTRVPESGVGELAEMGRAFNGMARSLESSRDELESQNSELEAQQAELERAVEELAREKDRVDRLYRVGRAIAGHVELEDVCRTVVAQLGDVAGADLGAIYVFPGADRDSAVPIAARGVDIRALAPVEPNVGLAGRAVAERTAVIAAHGQTGLRVPALGGVVAVAHELHVPLVNGSDVVGVLTLARLSGAPFGAADLEQLDYLAGRAAAGIAGALTMRVLRDQAALNHAVLDTASDAFVTSDQDDVITAWNPAAERLFGWTAAEAIGRRLAETIVPERHLARQTELTSGAGPNRPLALELDALHRDGHEFPIELTVSPLELNGKLTFNAFMRDISGRRRSDLYTRAQLAVTKALAEATSLDDARTHVISALCGALGWSVGFGWIADNDAGVMRASAFWAADGIDAEAFRELADKSEFRRGQGLPGRVWATGDPVWIEDLSRDPHFSRTFAAEQAGLRSAISFPVINDDQMIGTLEFFSTEIQRPDPELLSLLGAIGSQISQFSKRKRVELEADRLKDEFFALVSHELRTPLTSIIGYLELVLEDADSLDPTTGRFLQVVERNSRRLHRLVGDLLFVAQVEAGRLSLDRTAVPLDRVVNECVEAARPRAEESGVTLNAHAEAVGHSDGDPDRLGQMLDNLVSNALKFTPEGGTVDITLTSRGGRALIEVRDTGVGIPAAEQDQLFQRFFRSSTATERAIPGVGLGLTISRAIAEAHGGTITFTSEEGRGTTFRVDVPLAAALPDVDPTETPKEVVL
jgi:PAS domain S-box-containing protein